MNTTQTIPREQFIDAAQTMPLPELEKLIDDILIVRAERVAPHLSGEESRLLKIVGRSLLSDDEKARMRELQRLRDTERLSSEGYAELADLIDDLEKMHAERMLALSELAKLRGVTLETAMKQVGLNLPDYE